MTHNMSDSNTWSENIYTIKDVVYRLGLPQTISVESGYYSEDEENSLASGDVIKLQSVTEKQSIIAVPDNVDTDDVVEVPEQVLISAESGQKIHVIDPKSETTTYSSVRDIIEKVPKYFRVDCDLDAFDSRDQRVTLKYGVCLEFLKAERDRGLKCSYRGNIVFLRPDQKGTFVRVPRDTILSFPEIVKRQSFPVKVSFVEEPHLVNTYADIDDCSGLYTFLGVQTTRYLIAKTIVGGDNVDVPGAVASTEILLPLDSDQVMLTDVRVMNQKQAVSMADVSKTIASSTVLKTTSLDRGASPIRSSDINTKGKSLERAMGRQKKGTPPPPPIRTVSVLQDDSSLRDPFQSRNNQNQDVSTNEPKRSPNVRRASDQTNASSGFKEDESLDVPPLPPRRGSDRSEGKMCGITLKSGSSDVPISLRIISKGSRKEKRSEPPEVVTFDSTTEKDDEKDESPYMDMKEVQINIRQIKDMPVVPHAHRESLSLVHRELWKKHSSRRSPPAFKPPDPSDILKTGKVTFNERGTPHQKPTHVVSPSVRIEQENPNASVVKFSEMSVEELVECFQACKIPQMADICLNENLDGSFLDGLPLHDFEKEPFCLSPFHVTKLEKIKNGWRPYRIT